MTENRRGDARSIDSILAGVERTQRELGNLFSHPLNIGSDISLYVSPDGELLQPKVVPICSFGKESGTTMWAWANPDAPVPAEYGEEAFRRLAETTGCAEFTTAEPMELDRDRQKTLLAFAVDHFGARGLTSEAYGSTIWSMLVVKVAGEAELEEEILQRALYRLFDENSPVVFNAIRKRHPDIRLSFDGADLRGTANPWKGDLHVQSAIDYGVVDDHQPRSLAGFDLSFCSFVDANLSGVDLRDVSFAGGNLVKANLSDANLVGANLSHSFLNGANFFGARLDGARFGGSEIGKTLLVDVDLSKVIDLDEVCHSTASEVSFSTLVRSSFKIGERFLRSAGVSIGLLDDLRRGQRFGTAYSTCFLSYSTKDAEFAEKLYYSLQEAGVRTYWDRTNITAGEHLDVQLKQAILENDITIALLSGHSVGSEWMEREIEIALYYKRDGFTPIRLCDIPVIETFVREKDIRPDFTKTKSILDFSGWQEHDEFERVFHLLLNGLRR